MKGNLLKLSLAILTMSLSFNLCSQKIRVNPSIPTDAINATIAQLEAGDTLLFQQGKYKGPFLIQNINGKENLPIVILGSEAEFMEKAIIDNKAKAKMNKENNAFTLDNSSWITIENFEIRNCWTDLILARESSYISLISCKLNGGKRAIFAKGRNSHHYLIEKCDWEQHPYVWTHKKGFTWAELHHGKHVHYNGSLFQGAQISGGFVLRDNVIKNTFNAFRLSQIGELNEDPLAATNGEIYRNKIVNTSDNVLEPELHAGNLHFYHNEMINSHAFISLTEIGGGDIYIYGNTAVSLPESEDGWTIFKISSEKRSLTGPLYIYNNSWQVDFDIIGSPRHVWKNDYVHHFNNACYSEASDSFGIYFLGLENYFDYDCSNVPFPNLLTANEFEKNGLIADPGFIDPYSSNFKLKANSPCIDKGKADEELILNYHGDKPDIGAYDNGELIQGTPFRYQEQKMDVPYTELPRITRHYIDGDEVTLWFSLPMEWEDITRINFSLQNPTKIEPLKKNTATLTEGIASLSDNHASLTDNHASLTNNHASLSYKIVPLTIDNLSADKLKLTLKAADHLDMENPCLVLSERPKAENGQKLNNWASVIRIIID